jgi:hypothetical protein
VNEFPQNIFYMPKPPKGDIWPMQAVLCELEFHSDYYDKYKTKGSKGWPKRQKEIFQELVQRGLAFIVFRKKAPTPYTSIVIFLHVNPICLRHSTYPNMFFIEHIQLEGNRYYSGQGNRKSYHSKLIRSSRTKIARGRPGREETFSILTDFRL